MTPGKHESPCPLCPPERHAEILADLRGKRVSLIGLGLFGGGEGAARFLAGRGAQVTVTDLKGADELEPVLKRLSDLPLRYQLGGHDAEDLLRSDLVVANLAVPRCADVLRRCRDAGVPLTSPMNMFLTLCPVPVTAVTGAVGKSTTTAMLAIMLRQDGRRVRLGGNIGISLLPFVDQIRSDESVVLELSSVQLEDAVHLRWAPQVAVVTNVSPNHLDRYGTFQAYAEAKRGILAFQSGADTAILNAADPVTGQWLRRGIGGRLLRFDPVSGSGPLVAGMNLRGGLMVWQEGTRQQVVCSPRHVSLPGAHNVANAMAAAAAACRLGVSPAAIRRALASFKTLEHRLEPCGRLGGMTFYNDSDATAPQSTVAGMASFDGPLTLIAGGCNKDLDMAPLAAAVARRAQALVTIGRDGPVIAHLTRLACLEAGRSLPIREAGSLREAVEAAVELSAPGSTVLFSPACASFDMFQNFVERGRRFKELVADLEHRHRRARSA